MRPEEIRFLYDDDRWAAEKALTALRDIPSELRSEAAALLTDAGRSPGEIALIFDVDALAGVVGGQAEQASERDGKMADETIDRADLEASFASNQRLWDAWTKVHAEGEFYDVAGFREGGLRVRPYEIAALGDVTGKTLLHLQCHFGLDTLSWARLGARVTGADFSPASIRLARELAADIGIADARFVEANVYQLPVRLGDEFDIVYTSRGVLGWLPDIRGWARVVARFVKPGGRFYISEIHPVLQVFENEGVSPRELRLQYPYWEHGDPLIFDVHGSYADPTADLGGAHKEHGWDHGLGEIVTALIDAGLRIDRLDEQPFLEWQTDFLVESAPGSGQWILPDGPGELPLMFSLLASKPA